MLINSTGICYLCMLHLCDGKPSQRGMFLRCTPSPAVHLVSRSTGAWQAPLLRGRSGLLGKWFARGSYHQGLGGTPAPLGGSLACTEACCRSALVLAVLSRSLRQHLQAFEWVSLQKASDLPKLVCYSSSIFETNRCGGSANGFRALPAAMLVRCVCLHSMGWTC